MNTPLEPSSLSITADDLRSYQWQAELGAASCRECSAYYEIFLAKANMYQKTADTKGANVFRLLAAVASFWPNYGNAAKPFRPFATDFETGKRSPIPDDLIKSDLDALAGILAEIKVPEFCPRVADVLWISRKYYKAAQRAVEAYIESSRVLETGDMWPPFAERLWRAMQIGAQLGWSHTFHKKAIVGVEDAISRH